jgi:hypothetical protein
MIEGKKIVQISARPQNLDGTRGKGFIEVEHHVTKYKAYFPAGVMSDGGYRDKDLIQFWTDPGGLRTVNADDLVI